MLPVPDPNTIALFLDFDGTLVDIAPRPQDVVVAPDLLRGLKALTELLDGALAIVSGRSIADIDAHLDPLRLRCAGIHGAEIRYVEGGPVDRSDDPPFSSAVFDELNQVVARFPGVTIENKQFACAVHYRAAPDLGPALAVAIERFLADKPALVLMRGHCVYELKAPTHSKATAIAAFMDRRPFAGRTPIFIGDDVTDSFGFEFVRAHGGRAYSVGREMAGVDGWFATPLAVRRWLEEIASPASVAS